MRIIVTGGAGFIGSCVSRLAVSMGLEVLVIDKLTYAGNMKNLDPISHKPNYQFENVDICDDKLIGKIFSSFMPDGVIHLAAESHVDRSIDSPRAFIETNIFGTFNLLQHTRNYLNQFQRTQFKFHHVSTDEVYGTLRLTDKMAFTEKTNYDPSSPYSATKASSDFLVRAWSKTFKIPSAITNCSNNYGPYHHPEKFIPRMILNALQGKSLPIYGDGKNIRDWLYVEDHAEAILRVFLDGKPGENYNVGANCEVSNINLVKTLCATLDELEPLKSGKYGDLITFVPDRPGHDLRYAIDASKIKKDLGWKAPTTLDAGLRKTIKWYLDHREWWEPIIKSHSLGSRLGVGISSGSSIK